jgi:ABC-2 type transport system ATP-binding protein
MEEADRCSQIAFISQGRLLTIGNPAQLKSQVTGRLLEVECQPLMKASRIFRQLPGVTGITAYGTTLHLNVSDEEAVSKALTETAHASAIDVGAIRPIPATLDDVFATLVEPHETH